MTRQKKADELRNIEAEKALLGSLLINPTILPEVRLIVSANDFSSIYHGAIFEAFCDLTDEGATPDVILLDARLSGVDYGGPAYLAELSLATPTSLHAKEYAEVIKGLSRRRGLVNAASSVAKLAFDKGRNIDEVASESQATIIDAATYVGARGPQAIDSAVETHYDYVSKTQKGEILSVPTGLIDYDKILAGGFKQTTINLLGARTGMGKTAVCTTLAKNVALNNGCPAFFSLEQPTSQIVTRLVAHDAKVSMEKFDMEDGLTSIETKDWESALSELKKIRFYIDDTPGLGVIDIVNRVRVLKRAHNINIVIIDYLQLVRPSKNYSMRYLEIKDVLDHLHQCARELMIPIFSTVQIGRGVDTRQDKRPVLKDLRESGDLEQYGYTITFLHRDEFYDPTTINQRIADLIVAKHRQGPTGTAQCIFRGEYSRLDNIFLRTVNLSGGTTI